MVFSKFEELKELLQAKKEQPKKVVVADATDSHTLGAVTTLFSEGLIVPFLVGKQSKIEEVLAELNMTEEDIAKMTIIDCEDVSEIAFKSVELIRTGQAEVLMKGHLQTRDLLKAVVNKETGIRESDVLSHVSINEVPSYHKLVFLTDGGMLLTPSLADKKAVLANVLSLTKKLGYESTKVAVLDASESVNPKLQASLDAKELKEMNANGEFEGAVIEGPISLDLSMSKSIAKEKEFESPVAGDADVLLVPDIVSGNLLGKSMTVLAGGKMAGLILGAKVPIVITSRGSSTEEKINSLLIASAL